jgi:hypothetical protein
VAKQRCPEGGEMIKAAQNLAGYFARHAERPSFKASMPGAELPARKSVISRQSHVSAWNLRDSGPPAGAGRGSARRRPAANRPAAAGW